MCDLCRVHDDIPAPLVRDEEASSMRMLGLVLWYVMAVAALAVAFFGYFAASARADDFDQAARIAYDNTRSFSTGRHTTDGRADCTDAAFAAFLYLSNQGHRPGLGFCGVGGVPHVFVVLEDRRAIDVNNAVPVGLKAIGCDREPSVTPWSWSIIRRIENSRI